MMRTKTAITMALVMMFGGGLAFAQDGGFPGRGPHPGGDFMPSKGMLKRALGLTEDQVAEFESLRAQMKDTVAPLRERRREIAESLRTQMESDQPVPEVVGNLVIAQRDLREEMRAVREDFRNSFQAILTPEQAEKLEEIQSRRGHRGGGRRGFSRGLGPSGP